MSALEEALAELERARILFPRLLSLPRIVEWSQLSEENRDQIEEIANRRSFKMTDERYFERLTREALNGIVAEFSLMVEEACRQLEYKDEEIERLRDILEAVGEFSENRCSDCHAGKNLGPILHNRDEFASPIHRDEIPERVAVYEREVGELGECENPTCFRGWDMGVTVR